jgi:hypothetical protein
VDVSRTLALPAKPDRHDVVGDRLAASDDVLPRSCLRVALHDLLGQHQEAVFVDKGPFALACLRAARRYRCSVAVKPRALGERRIQATGNQREVADGLNEAVSPA